MMQQYVFYRMIIQFKKWIPAAIESRFMSYRIDPRLKVDMEGRYMTFGRLVFKSAFQGNFTAAISNLISPLYSYKGAIAKGMSEMEVYNMRKNLAEIITGLSFFALYMFVHGGDDEEAKKRRRHPGVKIVLTLLNRTASDINMWYNPGQLHHLTKNPLPLQKLVGDILKIGQVLTTAPFTDKWQYDGGSRDKQYIIPSLMTRITPGVKEVDTWRRIISKHPLEELNK